jgi:hypothetical protein
MPKGISLLNPDKEVMIKMEIENVKSVDEAVLTALRIHEYPLTFSDIERLMPEKFQHHERLSRALRRLIKQGRVQEIFVITMDEAAKAYALMTDTPILVGIPVRLMREIGYEVLLGFGCEEQKEPYDLYEVKADYILIHINPLKGHDQLR